MPNHLPDITPEQRAGLQEAFAIFTATTNGDEELAHQIFNESENPSAIVSAMVGYAVATTMAMADLLHVPVSKIWQDFGLIAADDAA